MPSDRCPQSSGSANDNNNNSSPSHITQSFRDQKQIESFIRSNKLLKIIEGASEQYVKTFQQTRRSDDALAAIIVVLPFVYADFLHPGSFDLLHLILEEPLQFEGSIKYCVFSLVCECIKAIPDSGIKTVDIAQVHVQLRFLGLPLQQSLIFDPSHNLYPKGLAVVVGILSAFTEAEKHVVLRDISAADLDALLRIDSPPLTMPSNSASQMSAFINDAPANITKSCDAQHDITIGTNNAHNRSNVTDASQNISESNIMNFNREPFPSQMGDLQCSGINRNTSFELPNLSNLNFSHLWATPETGSLNNSLLIASPGIEVVNLNQTEAQNEERNLEEFSQTATIKKEILNLSSTEGSVEAIDRSFEEEFAKFHDIDFDDAMLELDFEQQRELEQAHVGRMNKTQVEIRALNAASTTRLAATCPPRFQQISTSGSEQRTSASSVRSSGGYDPLNFLTLDYGDSIQDPNNYEQVNVLSNVPSSKNSSPVPQPLNYSKNEQLRSQQQVTAVELRNIEPKRSSIDAHIENVNSQHCSEVTPNRSVTDATMMPSSVVQLFDVIKAQYSDFSFIYALSAQLCQDRVPMDCFVNLKMGLLLSLASIGPNPDRPPIPVIAIGNDAYMSNYLLTNIGQLAARFIGPTDDVKRPSSSSANKTFNWIEADPIILAKGGVFYIGDWSRLKAPRADKLFKDIECSRIEIEKTTHVYRLEAAIWAHWRAFKCNAKDQQLFNNFVKVFGIPIIVDDANHEVLVNYILEQSSVRIFESTVDHLSISPEDMRQFLAVISKRTVDLSNEASTILQKYFVASRIERPDCLSKQSFVVLKQFSESFAKLAFRHEVLAIDAYSAIFMCENFIQNIFGANENPAPQLESHNYVANVDEYMMQFQKWVVNYINRYYDNP